MATQLQLRRGNTTHNNSFTGAEGELTVDTSKHDLRIHDGTTQGGYLIPNSSEVAMLDSTNNMTNAVAFKMVNPSIDVTQNPSSDNYGTPIVLTDKNQVITGYVRNGKMTTGKQFIGMQASKTINNTLTYNTFDIGFDANNNKVCQINGNEIATQPWINSKFQVVTSLPANPDANTFYFVKE